jgi:CRP-like cAMP-binding protein
MDALKKKYDEQIKSLMPISGLAPQYQNEVVQQAEILKFKKKQHVFKQGDVDPYTYYLLDGGLELEANGQLLNTIKGGSADAQSALSQLQPRQMSAKAAGKILVLRIARDVMDRLLTMDEPGALSGGFEVSEVEVDEDGGGDWMTRMLQSELFSRIPPANIQRVFAVMESVTFKAGGVVVEQGSPGDYYYIIQAGRCEVTRKASASGKPVKLAELSDGDSFGEEALVSDAKRNATVTMITAGELVRLTKEDFIELIKKPSLDSVEFEAAKALVTEGACWLDLRFAEEHAKDGIEASVNIPLNQLRAELKNLETDRIYVAYCDSGARSSAGAFLLAQNGFDVRHLEGGLIDSLGIDPAEEPTTPPPEPESFPEEPPAVAEALAPEPEPEPKPKPKPRKEAKKEAPAAPLESAQADVRAAELAEDVAKADTKMQEAMRLKAEAEALKKAAAKRLESKNKALEEDAAKAKADLQAEATKANTALDDAKRKRIELEKAHRAAEAKAEAERQKEEQRLKKLKRETEARLNAEKAKLDAEYAKQAELEEKAAKANAALEEAKRQRVELEEARLAAEAKAEAERQAEEERLEKLRQETEARLAAEKAKLDAEYAKQAKLEEKATQANAAMEEAKRQRVELEKARRAAEAEADEKRREEEERLEKLKRDNEARLNAEKAKLEAEYAKQAEELAKIQELKEQAKAELNQEREALNRKASAASRELKKAEKAKAEAEEVERRIREQSEAAIRVERERLEAEFARAAEQMSEAQHEREMAEMIKEAAVEKAARTIAEQKVNQALARKEDEAKLDAERHKLKEEARRLRKTLEDAKKVKAQALARAKADAAQRKKRKQQEAKASRNMIAAAHKVDPRGPAASCAPEDELTRANSLLAAAEAAHRQAEEAKQDLEDTQSWKKSELDALRKQMESELSDFLDENPTPGKDDDEEKKRTSKLNMFAKRRKAEEKKRSDANNLIVDDIASQLEK